MLGRLLASPTILNDSLLVFGRISQSLLLCYVNGTEETRADIVVNTNSADTCSSSVATERPNIQPGEFNIRILQEVSGRHRVYVADGSCTTGIRSDEFDVIRKSCGVFVAVNVIMPILCSCS